jgi:hypothetical protein
MLPITRPWSEADREKLKHMVEAGASPLKCAAAVRRKLASVRKQAHQIGSPFPDVRAVRRRQREAEAAAQSVRL